MGKHNFSSKCSIALLLALTTLACGGFSDIIQDGHDKLEEKESASLAERMKILESLLRQQTQKLSQQEEKLSALDVLFRAQTEHLTQQDALILQQAQTLSRQEEKLSAQDALLTTLRHQETVFRQQNNRLSQQDEAIHQLKQKIRRLEADQKERTESQIFEASPYRFSDPESDEEEEVTTEAKRADHNMMLTRRSVPHGMAVRSDDSGPLEVVVSQMGQRLTEVSADLQALKSQTSADIQTLKSQNAEHDQQIQNAGTSTFVRWGGSQCGNGSTLVYSGVVGGSYYARTGGATNFLCLTMSPVTSAKTFRYGAELYGAEYRTYDTNMNNDPVCAVCRSGYPTTIMIPGTNVCNAGWHRQYSGYLMAGNTGDTASTEYICVDSSLESRPASSQTQVGAMLYFTKNVCGSLPCNPYVDGKIVTCVVCSL